MGVDLAGAHKLWRNLIALLVTNTFADRDLAPAELRIDCLDVGKESVGGERHFGEVDQMRRWPVLGRGSIGRCSASKRRGRGEETRVTPHDDIDLDAAEARIVERI